MTDVERLLVDSPLFDAEWYALVSGAAGDRAALVRHHLATPVVDRVSPHPLFDPVWVRERWGGVGAGEDPFVGYVLRRPYEVRTSPLLTEAFVRRPAAQRHEYGPLGHLAATSTVGEVPADPWSATRGRRPYADLRGWVLERAREWRARRDGAPAPAAALPVAGPRIVVGAHADWRATARTLRALERTLAVEVQVAVVDDDADVHVSVMCDALAVRSARRVAVVRGASAEQWVRAPGRRVLLAAGVQPLDGWFTPLTGALDAPGTALVAPLLLAPDGTVRSAGIVAGAGGGTYDLLAGHPAHDAGEAVADVALVDVRRSVVAVDDLEVRGAVHVRPDARVVEHDDVGEPPADAVGPPVVGDADPWGALGFEVVAAGAPPRVRRPRVTVREGVPRLRWALRVASPAGPIGDAWGDTHFGEALARALRTAGHEVVVDRREAFDRPTTDLDDVTLLVRGLEPMRPVPGAVNLCWVISHPDLVDRTEAAAYDRVFAASRTWARDRSAAWGLEVEPLLQATDPALFAPEEALADTGHPVLFVGSSRGVDRAGVSDALAAEVPLSVYGPQWEDRLPPGVVVDTYLPNERLSAAYGAAGVVLNDHWDDMRVHGFVSNRLFDAVASGARVVTDDVAGLGDTFGRSVQVYSTAADLRRLCDPAAYDSHFGDLAERLATAERVRREHSFAARAERLVEVALERGAGRSRPV